MTSTIERPQAPESPSRVRHGASYWLVALVAVLGLGIGTAVGYWWGGSEDGTSSTATRDDVELTTEQERAVATVDELAAALNSGDSDLIDSFYSDEATFSEGTGQAVSRDDHLDSFSSLLTGGYEFESTATAVLGEPFGVVVDVSQFLTATHPDEPTVTIVMWHRIDPQTKTILEASVLSS